MAEQERKIYLSPSILGYEKDLRDPAKRPMIRDRIQAMIDAGIDYLHIDWMRSPFIPAQDGKPVERFDSDTIGYLVENFGGRVKFDFHLMDAEPSRAIGVINECMPHQWRGSTIVTMHVEAYRHNLPKDFRAKSVDLFKVIEEAHQGTIRNSITYAYGQSQMAIASAMRDLQLLGYRVGLALEPGTPTKVFTDIPPVSLYGHGDLILCMSVISGAGGQSFMPEVMEKVYSIARSNFPRQDEPEDSIFKRRMIQVDGGIKADDETLGAVLRAGANNIVAGSAIAKEDPKDIEAAVRDFRRIIDEFQKESE